MYCHIKIVNKEDCYGCRACEQICKKNCISIIEDAEGFKYPIVDEKLCTSCGLCVKHCPNLNNTIFEESQLKEPEVYAAKLKKQEILLKSSSGGMFSAIAEFVIENGGVVFGCTLDKNFIAKHISVDNKADLELLRGSKYLQSDLEDTYTKVRNYLLEGRLVFYTGTPCNIAGLKAFLGKEYQNLITADLICHGAPSQKLFSTYIDWLKNKLGQPVLNYEFRNKEKRGWSLYYKVSTNLETKYSLGDFDPYYRAFLKAETYRHSCYLCEYAVPVREGDFTLGDFWGVEILHPKFYSSKGVSLVLINSDKGKNIFNKLKDSIDYIPSTLEYAKMMNGNLENASKKPYVRDSIYNEIDSLGFDNYVKRNFNLRNRFKAVIKVAIPTPVKIALKKLKYKIKGVKIPKI